MFSKKPKFWQKRTFSAKASMFAFFSKIGRIPLEKKILMGAVLFIVQLANFVQKNLNVESMIFVPYGIWGGGGEFNAQSFTDVIGDNKRVILFMDSLPS